MIMANVPRKHHYVPQVLLRGFTLSGTNTGKLHIVDVTRRTTYASTPEGSAKETDYNLVESEGVDPFAIESDLLANTVEGPAASALDALRRGELPDAGGRECMLNFIAMQALRAPSRREMLDDFTTRTAQMTLSKAFESDETLDAARRSDPELADLTREEAQEFIRSIVIKDNPTGHLANLLPSFGPILEMLTPRNWHLLSAPTGVDFVCSDDPVTLVPMGVRPPTVPPGFGSLDAQVFMPVGRSHALLGMWPVPRRTEPAWEPRTLNAREVALFNTYVVVNARRFVASATEDFTWALRGGNRAAYVELVRTRPT
jgi:Protein of unknown function (DUF4238)